jgi:hypothetical protein
VARERERRYLAEQKRAERRRAVNHQPASERTPLLLRLEEITVVVIIVILVAVPDRVAKIYVVLVG